MNEKPTYFDLKFFNQESLLSYPLFSFLTIKTTVRIILIKANNMKLDVVLTCFFKGNFWTHHENVNYKIEQRGIVKLKLFNSMLVFHFLELIVSQGKGTFISTSPFEAKEWGVTSTSLYEFNSNDFSGNKIETKCNSLV